MIRTAIKKEDRLSSLEFLIIKNIFISSGVMDSYTLFRRTKVSFPLFERTLRNLEEKGFLEIKNLTIKLSKIASDFIMKNISEYGCYNKEWRDVPLDMKIVPMSLSHKYIPSIRLLDKKKFVV